jgi:uncharacterized protein (DUF1015 family)
MAEIRPFRGVRYNTAVAGEMANLICPPYDIISPEQREAFYHRSPYNYIRLEYEREFPQDTARDNRYTRSAATLEAWLQQGIMAADESPAIYLHDHYFPYQGQEHRRRGIMARVRLEEWDRKIVRPHEGTLGKHKSDRLSLLWALQANTSPVLTLFQDTDKSVANVLAAQAKKPPLFKAKIDGERHEVWAITSPEAVNRIVTTFADQPVYIADGHHRYESALAYRKERAGCSSPYTGEEPFNFVMMTLVDFADPGLLVLPPHRMVRGISRSALVQLPAALRTFFDIKELPFNTPDAWRQLDALRDDSEADEVQMIVFGAVPDTLLILKLRDYKGASELMPTFHSELYKRLAVSVLDHVILEKLLGLTGVADADIGYSYDRQSAVNRVNEGEYQLVFLLNPIHPEVIKTIADTGDRMPRKSTYFFPKAPSGLVLNRLV